MRAGAAVVAVTVMAMSCVAVPPAQAVRRGATPTAPAQRLAPPLRTLTVVATGDILTEDVVNRSAARFASGGARYDFAPLFAPLAPIVEWADLAICHMELPIGAPGAQVGVVGTSPYGGHLIAAPYEIAAGIRSAGYDRCTTASNHSNDLGTAGFDTTLNALDQAGLSHAGTARTAAELVEHPFIVNGIKVGHLSYTRSSNTGPPRDKWRLNYLPSTTKVVGDLNALRAEGAEVTILSVHIPMEMLKSPTADDRQFITAITAATDVDVVIIHGPHTVQPVEYVNGTLVYWSVGNMVSGMGVPGRGRYSDVRTLDGLLAAVRIAEQPNHTWTAEPWTIALCTELSRRFVYPAITALDTVTDPTIRQQLNSCITRTGGVVANLH